MGIGGKDGQVFYLGLGEEKLNGLAYHVNMGYTYLRGGV
ncbi:hypothetical protein MTY_1286 [Moorella thermoacetica Y72]|uniref:Uncharacterized protein n=1 Tax=Moorella thermoacetica Y72 TaxID=1325331 RepID=A0A0S6UCP5_NEOTH|nr:hypothetical protein MTY_1286 [Moorella thermoacetica Y72]